MSARTLFGTNVHFRPQFFLALLFNENLDLNGRDGGLARRVKVVRHVSRFSHDVQEPRPDLHLFPVNPAFCEAAFELGPKFLRLLLHSNRVDIVGPVPQLIRTWTEDYLGQHNLVKTFVSTQLEVGGPGDVLALSTLREHIQMWARDVGMVDALRIMKLQELKTDLEKELGDCVPEKRVQRKKMKNVFIGWKRVHLEQSEDDESGSDDD